MWRNLLLIFLMNGSIAHSSELSFFNEKIDYWNNKKEMPAKTSEASPVPTPTEKTAPPNESKEFSWDKYLDPKNKEFFKEGDYTPPEPFMEIVRNPSDQNLKMWFQYLEKKNQLAQRLETKLSEYAQKNGTNLNSDAKAFIAQTSKSFTSASLETKRYRFRMYYDSHCPHCERMFSTLKELQEKGFYVEAMQVDDDPNGLSGKPVPTAKASKEEIKLQKIESVPLLLAGDMKSKTVFRITGYQTVESIFSAIGQRDQN